VEGDTLLTIAFRFSLTVDDILGVNPGIDPRLLSVGTTLVIPLGEEGVALIPTPTPAPLTASLPDCYPAIDGGMWCFMKVENEQAAAVEGVSGEISLYAEDGEIIASEIAISPMDRLFSGDSFPLMAYFPAPAPRDQYIQGLLLGAFQVDPERARFLAAELSEVVLEYGVDRMAVQVTGWVRSFEREAGVPPGKLVVVAVAYGEGDAIVGLRKWELGAGESDEPLPFSFTVFSLGPPIINVDVLAEYQPAGEILTETATP
jgi:hypothetical protein